MKYKLYDRHQLGPDFAANKSSYIQSVVALADILDQLGSESEVAGIRHAGIRFDLFDYEDVVNDSPLVGEGVVWITDSAGVAYTGAGTDASESDWEDPYNLLCDTDVQIVKTSKLIRPKMIGAFYETTNSKIYNARHGSQYLDITTIMRNLGDSQDTPLETIDDLQCIVSFILRGDQAGNHNAQLHWELTIDYSLTSREPSLPSWLTKD
jgi:hypothetical protein